MKIAKTFRPESMFLSIALKREGGKLYASTAIRPKVPNMGFHVVKCASCKEKLEVFTRQFRKNHPYKCDRCKRLLSNQRRTPCKP